MKKIFVSQRVDIVPSYGERRDALDQQWAKFLLAIDCIPIPVPNNADAAKELLASYSLDGILLTGGNSHITYGGNAAERDEIDNLLIDYAAANQKPLIGVCRGMQSVILQFGGTLKTIDKHIAIHHNICGKINRNVNSYHSLTADSLPECLEILAQSDDGAIEAVRHMDLPIFSIMWHPEREQPFNKDDLDLFLNSW